LWELYQTNTDTNWKVKDNPQDGRKYLQIIYLIRDVYLEYIKNSYNSTIKNPIKRWTRSIQFSKKDIQIAKKPME